MTDSSNTQASQQPKTPAPELKRLDALVGLWRSEGETLGSPSIKIHGTDAYEWLPGGFFLIHRVDVHMGDDKVDALEVIGPYEADSRSYPMRSFDNAGSFSTMQASVSDEGVWTFAGDTMRTTLTIADDGQTMKAHWEQSSDGTHWQPWMNMRFTRIK